MKFPWRRGAELDRMVEEARQGQTEALEQLEAVKAAAASREALGAALTRVADRNALADRIAQVLMEGRRA